MLAAVLTTLQKLIERSSGTPIALPSGATRAFRQTQRFSPVDVSEFERSHGVVFPHEYSLLLTKIGSAECFIDEVGSAAIAIYNPYEVPTLYGDFFAHPSSLRRFFPIASDNRLQEIVVLLLERHPPNHILVVAHDVPPEDWPDLANEGDLTSIAGWIQEALSNDGQLRPH
jgi:hypothetical protein